MKYFDAEEKELIESIENAPPMQPLPPSHPLYEKLRRAAHNHKEKKAVHLRLPLTDVEKMKVLAKEKGLPYQTLIKSLIHQYVNQNFVK